MTSFTDDSGEMDITGAVVEEHIVTAGDCEYEVITGTVTEEDVDVEISGEEDDMNTGTVSEEAMHAELAVLEI